MAPKRGLANISTASKAKSRKTEEAMTAAKEKRQLAGATKRTESGFQDLELVLQNKEEDIIVQHLRGKPAVRSKLVTLITTGLLEKTLNGNSAAGPDLSTLGRRAFPQEDGKWSTLSLNSAKWLLAALLNDTTVISWFEGKGRLDSVVASQAVYFGLGVTKQCVIPQGKENGHYDIFLSPLCLDRYKELGERLIGATKESLPTLASWWSLQRGSDGCVAGVVCANRPGDKLKVPFDFGAASDWVIQDQYDFELGRLVSDSMGLDVNLRRIYEKNNSGGAAVIWNQEFHYPDFEGCDGEVCGAEALALGDAPKKVRMMDKQPSPLPPIVDGAKASILAAAAPQSLLANMGPRPVLAVPVAPTVANSSSLDAPGASPLSEHAAIGVDQ